VFLEFSGAGIISELQSEIPSPKIDLMVWGLGQLTLHHKHRRKSIFGGVFHVWECSGELAQFLHCQTQTSPLKINVRRCQWEFGLELGDDSR
jgi:hypothetical protein